MESLIMGVLIAAVCIVGFNLLQYLTSTKSKQIEEAKKEVKVEFVRMSEDPHTKREGPNNTIRCSCGFVRLFSCNCHKITHSFNTKRSPAMNTFSIFTLK